MSQSTEAGKLPGWTVLVSLLGCAIALMILLACRHIGLSWWIGVPAAIAVTVASVFFGPRHRAQVRPVRAHELIGKFE
ncbi:hypothetical protein KEH59_00645 (plasmid) [Burkholderia contaminans]|uniref:hypothetical protein n=1 Tax=Burkholderia contaminans TaxID=488447 RepID=UPI001BA49405|nr:hypothetical protein [Burkholderia contaminans]QUN45184.1 hypothetical protein KEH59_00645 [Burkholderia contaminans]